jgi:hypothetical protein
MEFTLDFFVAQLKCPHCGAVSAADDTTKMVTYIRDQPALTYLGEGQALEIPLESMSERSYLTVQTPNSGDPIRILHPWVCPSCGWYNWAEIVVHNDVIESISAVKLNRETLERANYIHAESKGVAAALTERPYIDITDDEVVPILRKLL